MNKRKVYFENLDALRAIAAMSVVLFHLKEWLSFPQGSLEFFGEVLAFNGRGGELGVHFFFILSGFLITYLILAEESFNGKFSLFKFYLRRLLRIWPLYMLSLFLGFFIVPMMLNEPLELDSAPLYFTFLANIDNIIRTVPNGVLGVQWSVAIEEQFYILWPLLFFLPRRALPYIIALGIILSETYYVTHSEWIVRYAHTFSNSRLLFLGGLLGYVSFYYKISITTFLSRISKHVNLVIYMSFIAALYFHGSIVQFIPALKSPMHFTSMIFFSYVIIEQVFSPSSFFKIGRIKILERFGKISYGIYLLHMVVIYPVSFLSIDGTMEFVGVYLGCIFTVLLLSEVSYRYFEKPFLKIKTRFSFLTKD